MKTLWMVLMIVAAGLTTACNTTRGVGQDVEATGQAIENTANKASEEIDEEF